jgi:hypothetical protein
MKNKSHRLNGLIDAALLTGFVLACFLDLTGQEAHQWLGMAMGGIVLYHLWRHQAWVLAAGRRWLSGLANRARLYALIDLGLFVGFTGIISSGIVISSWLNLPLSNYAVWRAWHVGLTLATLGLLATKLGLHWRWIAQTLRLPTRTPAPASATAPAEALGRRDFLKVMGGVSVAAFIVALGVVGNQVAGATSGLPQPQTTAAAIASNSSQSATTCQVQCNRRCSYPGRCRRYVDANQNGRCDWGECS